MKSLNKAPSKIAQETGEKGSRVFSTLAFSTQIKKSLFIALTSTCAALYAVLGYLSYLGFFTPVIGVVRFWPVVFVPAVFSAVFHPLIGGLGAALGIFISDMAIHGNALLSITAGVPSNFLGFYTIGAIHKSKRRAGSSLIVLPNLAVLGLCGIAYQYNLLNTAIIATYTATVIVSIIIALMLSIKNREWRSFMAASSIGLLIGSIWIGVTVWAYSQAFLLPGGLRNLASSAIIAWTLWVYCTEIPFLYVLAPPIIEVLKRVGLTFRENE